MSLDWTHQFCLSCDKQTDGTTYCSESCRLADYEKTSSTPSSGMSSPALADPSESSFAWTFSKPTTTSRPLYLAPAYDFTNARPYGQRTLSTDSTLASKTLSPSHSHSSLSSMRSSSSTDSTTQLSEKAARELRAYARSFESVRLQRRRSY